MEEVLILVWIAIVIIGWFWVKKNRPHWVGLGENRDRSKLGGVKFQKCPNCQNGTLDPIFRWWQYAFLISTPIGFVLLGSPSHYVCNTCNSSQSTESKFKLLTRLSLSHKLTKPFFVGILVNMVFALLLAYIFVWNNKI